MSVEAQLDWGFVVFTHHGAYEVRVGASELFLMRLKKALDERSNLRSVAWVLEKLVALRDGLDLRASLSLPD
jgi:hypothetical protein